MPNDQLLGVLTREGVLINVSVRYWRAAKKLNAEDLGLDPDDVIDRLISLGHKKLLPRDALARFALLESRAHALVEASTFPFLNGLGHFLPNAKLRETTDKLKSLEIEFIQAQAAFLREYADLRQSALREWQGAEEARADASQPAACLRRPAVYSGSVNKRTLLMEAPNMTTVLDTLPPQLKQGLDRLIREGWFKDAESFVEEAARRYLESHAPTVLKQFIEDDIRWGLHGAE